MQVQELISDSNRYQLIHILHHNDIQSFVLEQYSAKTPWIQFYKLSRWFLILLAISLMAFWGITEQLSGWQILAAVAYGLLSFIVLIPIHESIHGIASLLLGAKKVRFKVLWRKLAFLAEAPEFVMNFKTFFLIAIAPFFIINSILLIWMLFHLQSPYYLLIGLVALLVHTLGCIGDFALISFFEQQKEAEIYTFDRAGAGCSYFYKVIK